MKNKLKKCVVLLLVLVFLSSGFWAMSGCEGNRLEQHRDSTLQQLKDYVGNMSETHFSEEGWVVLQEYFWYGLTAIGKAYDKVAIDAAHNEAIQSIRSVERGRRWGYSDCGTFALSIFIQETVLQRGENFVVDIVLKNLSDEDIEIGFCSTHLNRPYPHLIGMGPLPAPLYPRIAGWQFPLGWYFSLFLIGAPGPTSLNRVATLEGGEYFNQVWDFIGGYSTRQNEPDFVMPSPGLIEWFLLDLGVHNLSFLTWFSINPNTESQQNIVFYSNTIEITVL